MFESCLVSYIELLKYPCYMLKKIIKIIINLLSVKLRFKLEIFVKVDLLAYPCVTLANDYFLLF